VTIETAAITLDDTYAQHHSECAAGQYVVLAVSDSGRGMDEETRAHLFEPFFTTKELGRGTGLGLATVFGIVKQNNGFIYVFSEPGQGTTFKIYLPRAAAEPEIDASPPADQLVRGTETVLLVEDETQILELGRQILEKLGYRVLTACSPESALTLASEHQEPIQLLITDVVMPGMNGKELYRQLTASHPAMKCIYMSGYTADVIAHRGVLDHGVSFLQKPFTTRTLAESARQVLGS
jgi:two-component system cell cycle sensor histidine kinase/response regulator CckA